MTRYEASLRWAGSTGLGWERYDRAHEASGPPAEQTLRLTTGEAKGDPVLLNPEQLVVMAASSCQMLWFLHLAAKARIDVVRYEDEASEERVRRLCATAHERCNVANSLRTEVTVAPVVERS